jgi:hypothetical protein
LANCLFFATSSSIIISITFFSTSNDSVLIISLPQINA